MFSFGELFVVVTAAGILLGKHEIKAGARYIGIGLGRMIGMLQGVRIRYEEKSRGTQLYELHRSVKRGLDDVGTIGSDLHSIGSGRFVDHIQPTTGTAARAAAETATATATARAVAAAAASIPANFKLDNGSNPYEVAYLSRLILAEDASSVGRPDRPHAHHRDRQMAVDVIVRGVKESILSEHYSRMVPPLPHKDVKE